MDRQEILAQLGSFPYDRREYWIVTGAAMVLYGIKEQTADIDLGCSRKLADLLEKDGHLLGRMEDGKRHFKVGSSIEVFEEWLENTVETVSGYQVVSIKGLIGMKYGLGRDKDHKDIELIKDYLANK